MELSKYEKLSRYGQHPINRKNEITAKAMHAARAYKSKSQKKTKHKGGRFECNKCYGTFTSGSSLSIHKESKHDGMRYVICHQCDGDFSNQKYLSIHKKLQT